ncbi:MAG TPA: oligosaccharide flippase family protein [Gammaproteobacteria bacterium]|nr:oligosaccharide flippase family protein [Gammaproteobacteria bacterium]
MLKFGALARNTLWMTFGQGVRILVQFVYFVLIARILHSEGYGAFSGVVALVAVLAPFAGWGSGSLLIKNVARAPQVFPIYWGRSLVITAISAAVLLVIALLLGWLILPKSVSLLIVLWVAISDLFFARVLEISGQAFQAFQKLSRTAMTWILLACTRVCAVLLLMKLKTQDDLLTWAILYMCGTAIVALSAFLWVCAKHGRPRWDFSRWHEEFGEGFFFAAGLSAQRIYMDSDKTLLTRFSTLQAAGIYSAAARVIDVAFVPVSSLLASAYARFFIHGGQGIRGSTSLAKQLMPVAVSYAVIVGMVIYLCAPVLPWLLGSEYAETASAARWLAVVPLLMTFHQFAAYSLTGAGRQPLRAGCEFGIAIINVLMNIALIPLYTWKGSAAAVIASDVLLATTLWAAIWILHYRQTSTPG